MRVYPEIFTHVLLFCGGLSGSHNWPFPRSTTSDFKWLRIDAILNTFTSIRETVHLSPIQLTLFIGGKKNIFPGTIPKTV